MSAFSRPDGDSWEFLSDGDSWEFTTTGKTDIKIFPKEEWQNKLIKIKENSNKFTNENFDKDELLKIEILAPKEICEKDTVPLYSVILEQHNKDSVYVQYEMIKSAREFISNAYIIGSLDPALPKVLGSIIESKGLYENNIGEFFLLYGKFEQKFQVQGNKTRKKMQGLIQNDQQYMKSCRHQGKNQMQPLPYAVRNILAHKGTNPNTLDKDGMELRTSIELLRKWVEL